MQWPTIIQGGMGVHISTPSLANDVAMLNGLGTVSGVAADKMLARILQAGDNGGHYRRALSHFPFPDVAQYVLDEYFVDGGIVPGSEYKPVPAVTLTPSRMSVALLLCSNFSFVWLAKEGHTNPISINWLEKMQMPHLYSIAGAMLAGVQVVTMGAGIPLQIPAVLDALATGKPAEYRIAVSGAGPGSQTMRFDPRQEFGAAWPTLERPAFLPIVSSDTLAALLAKKLPGGVQGFVVEAPTAGGHNAPPREHRGLNESGEPIYGPRDEPDFAKLHKIGLPFWLGGSYASPEGLSKAKTVGAYGIQVGSIFALSENSGLDPQYRREVIRQWHNKQQRTKQDPHASPTGFPFQVAQLLGTLSEESVFQARRRVCNQHGLSTPHQLEDGTIVYRCRAERVNDYVRHGGTIADTDGVRCLCNGLIAATGLGNPGEPVIITLGGDLGFLDQLTTTEKDTYTAAEALAYLRRPVS